MEKYNKQPKLERVPVENFPKYSGLPFEYYSSVVDLAKRLDPYETFATEAKNSSEEDWLAAVELIEGMGVFDEEFAKKMETGVNAILQSVITEIKRRRLTGRPDKGATKEVYRGIEKFNQVAERERPLLELIMGQSNIVIGHVTAEDLKAKEDWPIPKLRDYMAQSKYPQIQNILRMHIMGCELKRMKVNYPDAELDKKDCENFHQLYKDVTLVPTGEAASADIKTKTGELLYQLRIGVSDQQSPFILAYVKVARGNDHFLVGISRLTGEITSLIAPLYPISKAFATDKAYQYFKFMCWNLLDKGYDKGILVEERPFDETFEKPELAKQAQEKPELADYLQGSEAQAPEFGEQTPEEPEPEFEKPLTEQEKRIEIPKNLRYREVVSTLQRCGVEIRPGKRHGVAIKGDKSIALFNPHKGDPTRNQYLLRRVLSVLGVEEEFAQNLKRRQAKAS